MSSNGHHPALSPRTGGEPAKSSNLPHTVRRTESIEQRYFLIKTHQNGTDDYLQSGNFQSYRKQSFRVKSKLNLRQIPKTVWRFRICSRQKSNVQDECARRCAIKDPPPNDPARKRPVKDARLFRFAAGSPKVIRNGFASQKMTHQSRIGNSIFNLVVPPMI